MTEQEYVPTRVIAKYFSVTPRTVCYWVDFGVIPEEMVRRTPGGHIRISISWTTTTKCSSGNEEK